MNRLSAALRIDNHPLLRKRSSTLRPQDIPANIHLSALRRNTALVLEDADAAQAASNSDTQALRSRIANQQLRIQRLRTELDEYIESLTEDRAQTVWSSKASLSTARSQFIAQVSAMARANWPKRSEMASASKELESLSRQLAETETSSSGPSVTPDKLRMRLRNIARVLDAAKQARQELREQREADRRRKAQESSDAARYAALKREEDKRQKEAVDRLQAELDREKLLIRATAQRFVNRENLVDVIEDLKLQGVSESLRIAQQATIYAKNVLLSHQAP